MELIYILLIVFIDRITKYFARLKLMEKTIAIIPNCFDLTYLENQGAAFGIFRNKRILLIGATSAVVAFMLYYLLKNRGMSKWMKLSFILIISGAIGNLIDRISKGYVIDFFHFYIGRMFDWPVFNVADICVVCGTILLAVILLFVKE